MVKASLFIGGKIPRGILLFGADRHGEQLARPRDVGGAAATGQQSVVPDAVEAPGQHVHQEASDELVGRQRHSLIAARPLDPVILPPEGDAGDNSASTALASSQIQRCAPVFLSSRSCGNCDLAHGAK